MRKNQGVERACDVCQDPFEKGYYCDVCVQERCSSCNDQLTPIKRSVQWKGTYTYSRKQFDTEFDVILGSDLQFTGEGRDNNGSNTIKGKIEGLDVKFNLEYSRGTKEVYTAKFDEKMTQMKGKWKG
jgi:hypothetical protein